jgi:glycosyltransferase involved in cell wall biosynthesis
LTARPPELVWNAALYRTREALMKRFLARADALVMGSRFILESFGEQGFLPEGVPAHVVPYGVRDRSLSGPGPPSREPRRPLVFGFIGSLLPHKGVHDAVDSFRSVPPGDAVLEVWGDPSADPAYFDRLRSRAAPGSVRFHGRFREEEKGRILSSLDVLLVPSRGLESFGLVAREAFVAGTPVLASRRGALSEIYGAGEELGYFEPGDPADLERRVRALIDDPGLLPRWRRRLPPVKGMAEHAREIDEVYETVLRGGRGRARRATRPPRP